MNKEEYKKRCKNGEPIMRSCWNCNPAHKYLKKEDYIIWCYECGKLYFKGKLLKIKGDSNE